MNGNKELKVHSIQLTGRSLCSIRSNRKWCKRRGSSLQCQNCFFVYTISDCNLKNLANPYPYLIFSIRKCLRHFNSPSPSFMRGIGVSFFLFFIHNNLMNILQTIFNDHYDELQYFPNIRSSVLENVNKMIHCGDPSFGGAMFGCTKCGNLKFVPFRCHSRFCPTCGNMYSIDRTTSMSFKLLNTTHRHCVFTISENLRPYFLKDRSLLNCLFSAVRSVVLRLFHKDNKSELFTPGFVCVLHTFGRDLKWNPHIHVLIAELKMTEDEKVCKNWNYFNFDALSKRFQVILLELLSKELGPSFNKTKNEQLIIFRSSDLFSRSQ